MASCSMTQKKSPRFDIDLYRTKFQNEYDPELDLYSIQFDFKKEPLDSTEYVSVFQEPFNRVVIEDNPHYFYSIQEENPEYTSITVFHLQDAYKRILVLVNHDSKGKLIGEKKIAVSGADGNASMEMKTKRLNDSTFESNYLHRDVSDTGGETETEYTFRKIEVFKIQKDGTFETVRLDTLTETKQIVYP